MTDQAYEILESVREAGCPVVPKDKKLKDEMVALVKKKYLTSQIFVKRAKKLTFGIAYALTAKGRKALATKGTP